MPPLVNWFLRLVPTNPIVMRLVYVGSRQMKHLYIRAGYLALMIVVLLFVLLDPGRGGALSLRELASDGANMFRSVSFLQVALICLLTPVFMAGAGAAAAGCRDRPSNLRASATTRLPPRRCITGRNAAVGSGRRGRRGEQEHQGTR